ncbi:GTPase Era [Candidatus Kapabacteria bacterium]|nr:GTPase Era [Candidatus Kapabacteria bacterium]
MKTKAGYAVIIGKPNAGKSTLLNGLLDYKLSIVSPKPQTTRKRVLGIYNNDDTQIIFFDTPGLLKPKYEMQRSMMNFVNSSLDDADLMVYIQDIAKLELDKFPDPISKQIFENFKKPKILILNKIDLKKDVKETLPLIKKFYDEGTFDQIVPISAKSKENLDNVIKAISQYIPENPFYYDPELLSTEPQRFFVSELIREQIFFSFKEEIPYSTEVSILEFKEREKGKWYIHAEIIVERDNQKKILIGKGGAMIKNIGQYARKEIEELLGMDVYLEIFVKVRKDWRNNKSHLRSFGY